MELREYLRIIANNFWLILAVTLIALTTSAFFTYEQTPIYESESTFITGLGNTGDADQQIYLTDTVFGRQRIFVTQCDIMKSGKVFERALELLNLTDRIADISNDYIIKCNVLPESNVLLILVEGPAPAVVTELNRAIGIAGMAEVNSQFSLFPMSRLDNVFFNEDPIAPNYSFNIVLGAVLGLAVSVTIVMLLEYLKTPQEDFSVSAIRDPRFGLYNDRYFENRLMDEINRSKKWHHHLTLVMIRLSHNEDFGVYPQDVQDMLIRNAVLLLEDNLRESDILGHYEDMTFMILMPQTPGEEAYEAIHSYHETLRSRAITIPSGLSTYFVANSGMVDSNSGKLTSDEMREKALGALQDSEDAGENEIRVVRLTNVFFEAGNPDEELPAAFLNDAAGSPASTSGHTPAMLPDDTYGNDNTYAGVPLDAFDDDFDPPPAPKRGGSTGQPSTGGGAFTSSAFTDNTDFNAGGVSSQFLDSLFSEDDNTGSDADNHKPAPKKRLYPRSSMPQEKKNKPE